MAASGGAGAASAAGGHEHAVRIANEVLAKKDPIPAQVLCWGWLLKQGEGGLLHGDTFKTRWFVLARVPHATVLIYYDRKCMDEDHILGYIDMRRVVAIREGTKTVSVDNSRSAITGLVMKLKGMMASSSAPSERAPRPVLELVTASRVYTLCPATVESPGAVSTAAATGPSVYGKPLYLFGWPFPVPHLEGAVMSTGEGEDMEEDEEALAASDADATLAAQRVTSATDPTVMEAFSDWRDRLQGCIKAEKATRVFPVVLLVDSTGTLPQRLLLRVTPTEIAMVSVDDKDVCYGAIPFHDMAKWDVQVESELHITARTRSRLVARPDRSGFTTQRPTRPSCHYVFKSSAARTITAHIDGHIRALAAAMGEDVSDMPALPESSGDGADGGAGGGESSEEDAAKARAKLVKGRGAGAAGRASPKVKGGAASGSSRKLAVASGSESEEEKPKKGASKTLSKSGSGGGSSRKVTARVSDSDESEEEKPKKKAGASSSASKAKKKVAVSDSDEESEEEKPKKKSSSSSRTKKAAASDSDDSEDAKPAKKSASSKKAAAAASDSD